MTTDNYDIAVDIAIKTNNPKLIETFRSFLTDGFGEYCSETDLLEGYDAGEFSGGVYFYLIESVIEEGEEFKTFFLEAFTSGIPLIFLHNFMEKFGAAGGFTTSIYCEWIEKGGYVGFWDNGESFETKLDVKGYTLVHNEKFHQCNHHFKDLYHLETWLYEMRD